MICCSSGLFFLNLTRNRGVGWRDGVVELIIIFQNCFIDIITQLLLHNPSLILYLMAQKQSPLLL